MQIRPLLMVACCICALCSVAHTDDLIPEHGKYSQTYLSDWSKLPTGRELARHDLSQMEFTDVAGEDVRQVFTDETDEIRISGQRLRVSWASPECEKYRHALYYFRNCERIVIEDMAVIQNHGDWRASSTFFFESCGSIEIRNCYLAGTSEKPFIRLDGCEEYFIDGVEIAGMDFGEGYRCAQGIVINNGAGLDPETGRHRGIYRDDARDLRFGVIQNSYFHDYGLTGPVFNHDGIAFAAPADGLIFNCWFENWEADAAIDNSHRRNDEDYQNHLHRTERCVFVNCHRVKTNGAVGSPTCSLLWCNNLYVDSSLTDYHVGWENWRVHETYIFTRPKGYFHVMHYREGPKFFRNCLMYSPVSVGDIYQSMGETPEQDITLLRSNYFMYLMPAPRNWLTARTGNTPEITTWEQWREAGFDADSTLSELAPLFADAAAGDYRLLADSPAAGAGSAETLQPTDRRPAVTGDFYGNPRPDPPGCGAFEVVAMPGG